MHERLPIATLIHHRCGQLGISMAQLARRMGYSNQEKARRRLDQILAGRLDKSAQEAIGRLPAALDLEPSVVDAAVQASREQLRAEAEEKRRAEFVPHAIIHTERTIPSQIFVCAIGGFDKVRRIDFDLSLGPSTFLKQALVGMNLRLNHYGGFIPTFGKATGLVINYSFDRRAEFDCDGKLLSISPDAMQLGEATIRFG